MVRLFVTLFIVLIATLFIGILSVQKIDATLFTKVNREFYAGLTLGTFELLDESIAGKSGTELQATVIGIKDQFDSPIDLISTQQSDLPKKGMDILEGGGIYMRDFVTDSVVLRKSRETDGIWSITMDTSELDENIAIATGPLNLVKDKLTAHDKADRLKVLEQLQKSYDIPISLQNRDSLDLTEKELTQLKSQQVAVRLSDERGELYWIEVEENGQIFQAGPFKEPTNSRYLVALLIGSFLAILFIGCLVWMWPLWRDLQRLRTAAVAIGGGQLDTRVRTRKTSLIRSVLDGFNDMATRTENMVASQRDLTNAVSHELRTPLARMMFDLEMAREQEHTNDRMRHLDSLEFNIGELNTMVDELLTYAKQERVQSPLELEELNYSEMHNWLNEQVARAKRSRENPCTIEIVNHVEHSASIIFSPRLMAHALSNTLQNAMRFADSRIEIHLEQKNNNWMLGVDDDGPGISPSDCERVFDPFSRLDESRQRSSGNFGLGLSIVRNIARWHQGEARIAKCQSLDGTRVEIQWPVTAEF